MRGSAYILQVHPGVGPELLKYLRQTAEGGGGEEEEEEEGHPGREVRVVCAVLQGDASGWK